MKVLLLTTHLNIGGVGQYIFNLAKGLKKRSIDCLVASSGGGLEGRFRLARIPLVSLNIKTKFEFSPKLLGAAVRLIKLVKDTDIDIIHAHTRVAQVLGQMVSYFTNAHFVTTCHGFFKYRRLSRLLFPSWGDKTIAISEAVRNHLMNDFNLAKDRVSVIFNGIDFENASRILTREESEFLKKNLNFKNGPVIGSVGRLSPVKGYKYLLFAIKDLKKTYQDINLFLIGAGPSQKELKALSEKLDIEETVLFMSPKSDIWKYLSIMDIFVFPSVQEGLGLSLLEAMANGRACIATSIGGISDVIEDGKNGILIPAGDSHSLAEAVRRLISDKGLTSRLEGAARETVKKRFSLDRMVEETIGFYKGVLGYRDIRKSG